MNEHLCFECKFNIRIDNDTDNEDLSFRCDKKIIENWSVYWFKIVFRCDGFEQDETIIEVE
jgi:hypothetical protein